jgi:hypothetical protein
MEGEWAVKLSGVLRFVDGMRSNIHIVQQCCDAIIYVIESIAIHLRLNEAEIRG